MRKLTAFVVLLVLSVVLVACGGNDDEPEPTVEPTELPVSTRIAEDVPATAEIGNVVSTPEVEAATPAGDEVVGTPVLVASPWSATPIASPVASPVSVVATSIASPAATPVATPVEAGMAVVPPVPAVETPPARIEMAGTVVLNGVENEAYVLTGEGCVALGPYSGLRAGRQVVIRNEQGTIVSVTALEAAPDAEGCAWEFVAAVPESEFYSVSVPMLFEQVFPAAQVTAGNGAVEIELP